MSDPTPEQMLRQAPIETQMRDAAGRNNPHRSKDALLVEGAQEIERLQRGEFICKCCGIRKNGESDGTADF